MSVHRYVQVEDATRPALPRHAALRFDGVRQRWVLLVPERVLAPDAIAVEILRLCDGGRRVDAIVDQLAASYSADRAVIRRDVMAMLQQLADRGFLIDTAASAELAHG